MVNSKGPSFNTIPPLSIPLRFFLTAPLFGLLAAVIMFYSGPELWQSRWHSNSLALTHLLTIGFMLMVMIGALYQFIPVMMGQLIPASKIIAPLVHVGLFIGSLTLCFAFLSQERILYQLALAFLASAIILFAASLLPLLIARLKNHLMVFLLRILFTVLVVTIGLGLYLLFAYSFPELQINYRLYTDTHALWGLTGWTVLLIMAVSSQIIPMFYVTPEFSITYLKSLSLLIVLSLSFILFLNTGLINSVPLVDELISIVLSIELMFFAIYTIRLIRQRKRKLPDATINFFYLSLISMIVTIVIWWLYIKVLLLRYEFLMPQFELIIAILLIYGLAISAMMGMLQKIVPFLIYLNLQQLSMKHPGSITLVPNMKKIISSKSAKIQFLVHCISLLLLIFSVYVPMLVWLAACSMAANFLCLFNNLLRGLYLYKKNAKQIMHYPMG